MHQYGLYVEYNGFQSLPVVIDRPSEIVTAETMLSAIKSFARNHQIELISFDELEGGAMRAYYQKKRLFRHAPEIIYYVCEVKQKES